MSTEPVRDFLLALNQRWMAGELERLAEFYHPDVVLLPPDLGLPIRGRDAVVASYREFAEAATLEAFHITSLDITPFTGQPEAQAMTSTAGVHVAHMRFDVAYELDGSRYREQGLEVYTVLDNGSGLAIVWRAQLVLDSRLAESSTPA